MASARFNDAASPSEAYSHSERVSGASVCGASSTEPRRRPTSGSDDSVTRNWRLSALFEEARRGYDGTRQYWLHGVFIGTLWASGRLHPGGVDVAVDMVWLRCRI